MGYSTSFDGILYFDCEMTSKDLAFLSKILGEHVDDHPEWDYFTKECGVLSNIGFELASEFDGIQWDGGEKFYGAINCINLITDLMAKGCKPGFSFRGELKANGEEYGDSWLLKIDDMGKAYKQDIIKTGDLIECPFCEGEFHLDGSDER